MEVGKVLHMNAGLGDSSYAKNSTRFQRRGLEFVEPIMEDNILSMKMKMLMECKTVCIADLGCSSGPNALIPAENITKTLKAKYLSAGMAVPQCQVFFNDLPASDFNSLFRSLPSFSVNIDHQNEEGVADRSYFAAGVPGSFYCRLFPDKALHFVHSSFSLHWLSQVPADISKKNSVAWNKGKIFCGGSRAVGEAYSRQFQKDFNTFLRVRAEEVIEAGRMFLVLTGRTTQDPSDQGFLSFYWEALESSLNEFVSQGLIEEEKIDSFNIPLYAPCPEEVSGEVEMLNCNFNSAGQKFLKTTPVSLHRHSPKVVSVAEAPNTFTLRHGSHVRAPKQLSPDAKVRLFFPRLVCEPRWISQVIRAPDLSRRFPKLPSARVKSIFAWIESLFALTAVGDEVNGF